MTVVGVELDPYTGLAEPVQMLFWLALAVIVVSLAALVVLISAAERMRRRARRDAAEQRGESYDVQAGFLWVFVVPALNERVTIGDAVQRLLEVQATHRRVLVVDDGSDDGTGDVLAGIEADDLTVLRRDLPDARRGKASALDAAWRHVHDVVLAAGPYAGWDPGRVVLVIVDADGRLDPRAPLAVARHFLDERVGGVQALVRIYNQTGFLTWAQNMEFAVFGRVFQLGRSLWGTANMGGNGQFNRLSALDAVAAADGGAGPWRERLTEDQDIGIRLLQQGWRGVQEMEATIDQQGLPGLRRLYRQRTRWAQGSWQAIRLLRGTHRSRLRGVAAVDAVLYLLTPVFQTLVGLSLALSIVLVATDEVSLVESWPTLLFFYALSFVPGIAGILAARGGRGFWLAVVLAHLYLFYSWLIFPVVLRGLVREMAGRSTWAKTDREEIDTVPGESLVVET